MKRASKLAQAVIREGRALNSTALGRVPLAPFQFGELDATFAQPLPGSLHVALASPGIPTLRPADLPRCPCKQLLLRRARRQPPATHQRGHRRVQLADRQLRIFPPGVPRAPAPGTGNSPPRESSGASAPGN